jgi:uridylate kinase
MDDPAGAPGDKRILLKLSGEMLAGGKGLGIDAGVLERVAAELVEATRAGAQIGVVVGGGNIFRGITAGAIDRVQGDHMGMLATVINALALQDAVKRAGCPAHVMTALEIQRVAEPFEKRAAIAHLDAGAVVIFAAGTGCPFFSTDTAAALRAAEIDAVALFKGTKVDGVYDKDPVEHSDARRYERISYEQVLRGQLRVMDITATSLCMDNRIPVIVFDMSVPGNLARVLRGEPIGTRVGSHAAEPSTASTARE